MDDEEQWRRVDGFPNYAVSTHGRVINLETGVDLKGYQVGRFYPVRVNLRRDGITHSRMIHRLVAEAFFTGFTSHKHVYHLDGDIANNHYLNLRFKGPGGLGQFRTGTSELRVRWLEHNETGDRFRTVKAAAQALGLSTAMIYDILTERRVSAKGHSFKWVYEFGIPYGG